MRRKLLILSFISLVLVLATISTSITLSDQENENNFGLLLANAEAIASSSEGGSGITIFRVCSKKTGSIYCSSRRGYRKWAMNVNLRFGATGGVACPECPDQDFDYADDY